MNFSSESNIPNLVVMIRPQSFGFNSETAASNAFQHNVWIDDIALKAQLEFDAMVKKMKASAIEVEVFDDVKSGLPDSVFSNNWMAHVPHKGVVVFPMMNESRQAEVRFDIIDWIKNQTQSEIIIDLRSGNQTDVLEGTGSIVFDYRNQIAYAAESPRTNIALFESFCKSIDYVPFSFQSCDLKGQLIYHTNVVMTIANNYALVCLESISDLIERSMLEQKLISTGHRVIPISYTQMNHFAGNCIEVLDKNGNSKLLMSATAHLALTKDQIQSIEEFSEIISFDIPVIEKIGGGSVRCMVTGIFA